MLKQLLIAVISISPLLAGAKDASPQAYIGANILGGGKYDVECATGFKCDRNAKGGAGKFFAGFFIQPDTFGVEATLYSMGAAKGTIKQNGATLPGEFRVRGLALTGFYRLSAGDFSVDARAGAAYARGEFKPDGLSVAKQTKSAFMPTIGIGGRYAINQNWSLQLDWDRFPAKFSNSEKANADLYTLGASYRF
jgi:hypothetical protein